MISFKLFNKNKQSKQEHLQRMYPFTGNCPVNQCSGDGQSVGRCYHSLYGGYCLLHGNLKDYLIENRTGDDYETIDEKKLLPRRERDYAPDEVFN